MKKSITRKINTYTIASVLLIMVSMFFLGIILSLENELLITLYIALVVAMFVLFTIVIGKSSFVQGLILRQSKETGALLDYETNEYLEGSKSLFISKYYIASTYLMNGFVIHRSNVDSIEEDEKEGTRKIIIHTKLRKKPFVFKSSNEFTYESDLSALKSWRAKALDDPINLNQTGSSYSDTYYGENASSNYSPNANKKVIIGVISVVMFSVTVALVIGVLNSSSTPEPDVPIVSNEPTSGVTALTGYDFEQYLVQAEGDATLIDYEFDEYEGYPVIYFYNDNQDVIADVVAEYYDENGEFIDSTWLGLSRPKYFGISYVYYDERTEVPASVDFKTSAFYTLDYFKPDFDYKVFYAYNDSYDYLDIVIDEEHMNEEDIYTIAMHEYALTLLTDDIQKAIFFYTPDLDTVANDPEGIEAFDVYEAPYYVMFDFEYNEIWLYDIDDEFISHIEVEVKDNIIK